MSSGSIFLPGLTLAGAIDNPYSGNLYAGAIRIGDAVNSGTASPIPLDVSGIIESQSVNVPLPALVLAATVLNGALAEGVAQLPLPEVAGEVLNGNLLYADLTLPPLIVAGDFGTAGDLVLPQLAVSGAALTGAVAHGALLLPKLDVGGALYENGILNGEIALAPLNVAGVIVSTNLINGALTLLPLQVEATALSGNLASAAISLPLLAVDGQGFLDAIGTAQIVLPWLAVNGTLVSSVAAPVFAGVVLNTRTKAVTTYSGGAFNSLCQFNGLVLAATAAGVVALTGDNDQGMPIDAVLASGVSSFDSSQMKRVIAGYVGYRAAGDLELTLITDQHHEYIYRVEPRQEVAHLHPSKVKFGRGIDGRYWQWRLANRAGADFGLDSLRLDAEVLSRRV